MASNNDNQPQTDSYAALEGSDVEILHEDSSDSIEVLDVDKNADRNSIRTLTAGLESGESSPVKASTSSSDGGIIMQPHPSHQQPGPSAGPSSGPSSGLMPKLLPPTSYENIYDSSDYDEEVSINRPDSLSLPRPLQLYEKRKKVVRGQSESSMSTSSSVDALIEEVSKTPLSMQV